MLLDPSVALCLLADEVSLRLRGCFLRDIVPGNALAPDPFHGQNVSESQGISYIDESRTPLGSFVLCRIPDKYSSNVRSLEKTITDNGHLRKAPDALGCHEALCKQHEELYQHEG